MTDTPLRLRRIVHPETGRVVLLSFTSGMDIGVAPGMGDLADVVTQLALTGHVTAALVHAGVQESILKRCPHLPCGSVVDLFGGTWITTNPDRREQICSLEHAVRVGADAVAMTLSVGSSDESRQLRLCGQIARECQRWGMPLIVRIDTSTTDAKRQFSATLCGQGARLAYELGADLVAVNYSGEPHTFAAALKGIDIPVLVGGAPNLATDDALLSSVQQAVNGGAHGIALSGPMFWDNAPTPLLAKVAGVVRGSTTL